MTPKQIKEIDRAVAESMAKGSFTTKHRPTTAPPTGDQLWTGTHGATDRTGSMGIGRAMSDYSGSSYYAGGGGGSNYDEYIPPPMPSEPVRLWSMASSRGGVSVSSSRGRDSGYAEQQHHQQYQRPSSSATRKYTPSPQLYHRPSYYNNHQQYHQQQQQQQQQWGYNEPEQPYYYDEHQLQYSRPQYPPASYFPEGGYARAYVPPVGDDDGIVAGEPVNAPF